MKKCTIAIVAVFFVVFGIEVAHAISINGVSPSQGPAGTPVTITGSDLSNNTNVIFVDGLTEIGCNYLNVSRNFVSNL